MNVFAILTNWYAILPNQSIISQLLFETFESLVIAVRRKHQSWCFERQRFVWSNSGYLINGVMLGWSEYSLVEWLLVLQHNAWVTGILVVYVTSCTHSTPRQFDHFLNLSMDSLLVVSLVRSPYFKISVVGTYQIGKDWEILGPTIMTAANWRLTF